jgi:TIR domain
MDLTVQSGNCSPQAVGPTCQTTRTAVDFFISYTKADLPWAEWIAWQLELAGHKILIQAWDFRPGRNFVLEMDRACHEAEQTVAVLSPSYLQAAYTHSEWAGAFARDPQGERSLLLPVRVLDCHLKGLLAQVVHIDLVGLDEEDAKNRLLAQVRSGRSKPQRKPSFPGAKTLPKPAFPAIRSGTARSYSAEHQPMHSLSVTPLCTPDPGCANGHLTLNTEIIRNAEQELAKYMGPIAAALVRKAAKEVATPQELYSLLAGKIRNIDEQTTFLRKVTETRDTRQAPVAISAQPTGTLDPSLLANASKELVKSLGPIATQLVDKIAQTSPTKEDFYQRLATYLRSEGERTAFMKRMLSK